MDKVRPTLSRATVAVHEKPGGRGVYGFLRVSYSKATILLLILHFYWPILPPVCRYKGFAGDIIGEWIVQIRSRAFTDGGSLNLSFPFQ